MNAITRPTIEAIVQSCELRAELVTVIQKALQAARGEDRVVTASGAQNLLDQPEFQDLRKLKTILNLVEERKALYDLAAEAMDGTLPLVKIGQELGEGEMSACSIIAVPYRMADDAVGALALLGPRRMPYARLLAIMSGAADSLTHRLADED
jgi:heat-inducible transcriptional repressor